MLTEGREMRNATAFSSVLNTKELPKNLAGTQKIKTREQAKYLQRFRDTEYDSVDVNIFTRKILRPRAFSIVDEEEDGGGGASSILQQLSDLRKRKVLSNSQAMAEEEEEEGMSDNDPVDACRDLQMEFRSNGGWNMAGANLLAVTCWMARQQLLYARPRLTMLDFALAGGVMLVSGVIVSISAWMVSEYYIVDDGNDDKISEHFVSIGISNPKAYIILAGGMVGVIAGAVLLLRKLSHWQPVEKIIKDHMKQQMQKDFVDELVNICLEERLDPDNLDKLVECAQQQGLSEPGGKLNIAIMSFFRSRLKMQE